ncbi:hypothetical protein VP01_1926g1 [Puccinia sorghi]|uniref:Uncharacterized protein n=1 Tax=Puccinia sorghi TaxID=27349 RepID=A0A0L6VCG0_9BASI|nr:hypothetical protein VP01_1926g1 [Puccinia sorghi]
MWRQQEENKTSEPKLDSIPRQRPIGLFMCKGLAKFLQPLLPAYDLNKAHYKSNDSFEVKCQVLNMGSSPDGKIRKVALSPNAITGSSISCIHQIRTLTNPAGLPSFQPQELSCARTLVLATFTLRLSLSEWGRLKPEGLRTNGTSRWRHILYDFPLASRERVQKAKYNSNCRGQESYFRCRHGMTEFPWQTVSIALYGCDAKVRMVMGAPVATPQPPPIQTPTRTPHSPQTHLKNEVGSEKCDRHLTVRNTCAPLRHTREVFQIIGFKKTVGFCPLGVLLSRKLFPGKFKSRMRSDAEAEGVASVMVFNVLLTGAHNLIETENTRQSELECWMAEDDRFGAHIEMLR